MANEVGTGFVPIKPDTTGFGDELEKSVVKEGTPAAKGAGEKVSKVMAGAFAAGTALIGKGVWDFADFDKQMREVFTLLPGISGDAMGKMTDQVKGFSTEFGVLPDKVVPALYQSLSAGVPQDNVFAFMETAQKLAKGGVTDLTTSVDGLSSVVNAYGTDILSAEQASDLMFTTVKLGKTNIGELSGSLFQVTPTAAALGVSFDQVSAALAAMTLQGVPTSVATTQLRQLFVELSKEGSNTADTFKELTGKSFKDFIAGGGNLQNALEVLNDAAQENGKSISDMFGSVEAGSAALALTGAGAQTFFDDLNAMGDAAGATDKAFGTMSGGLSDTMDKLKARFSVALLNIGEAVAPTFEKIGMFVAKVLDLFGAIPGPAQAVIVIVGTLVAGVAAFAGPILKAIDLFQKLGGVFTFLAANPWIIAVAGLVAITILIIKNWDSVKEALSAVWDWIRSAGQAVADFFVDLWENVAGSVTDAWDTVVDGITDAIDAISDVLEPIVGIAEDTIGGIADVATDTWDIIKNTAKAAWDVVLKVLTGAWETIKAAAILFYTVTFKPIVDVWTEIYKVAQQLWPAISKVLTGVWDALATSAKVAWGKISDVILGVWDVLSGTAKAVWEGISKVITAVWDVLAGAAKLYWQAVTKVITKEWEIVSGLAKAVWEAVSKVILAVWDGLASAAKSSWETISKVITGVWDGLKTGAKAAWEAITKPIVAAWDVLSTVAKTSWNLISDTITGVWAALKTTVKAAWDAVTKPIVAAWDLLSSTAKTSWKVISDVITDVWAALKAGVKAAWDAIIKPITVAWDLLTTAAKAAWELVRTIITDVWAALKAGVKAAWDAIIKPITVAWDALNVVAKTVWDAHAKIITTAVDLVKTTVKAAWDAITLALKTAWDVIKQAATIAWEAFRVAVVTPVNVVKDTVVAAMGLMRDTLAQVWYAISGTASTVFGSIQTATIAVWNVIKGAIITPITAVRDTLTPIWNGISTTMTTVFGGIRSTVTTAIDGIKLVFSGLQTSASTVFGAVQTSISGVVNFIGGITNTVRNALSGLTYALSYPFKAAWNAVATAYNSTIGNLNISVPSWVPFVGGKSFGFPKMPIVPLAAGGVLYGPQMALLGEYAGAARNPEIVTPQNILRDTMVSVLDTRPAGGSGLTVNGPLIGHAEIREDRDITALSRELAREIDRRSRAGGRRLGGVPVT